MPVKSEQEEVICAGFGMLPNSKGSGKIPARFFMNFDNELLCSNCLSMIFFFKSMGKGSVYIFACRFTMRIFNFLDPKVKMCGTESTQYLISRGFCTVYLIHQYL